MSGEFLQVDLHSAAIRDNIQVEESIKDLGTPSSHVKLASKNLDMLEDLAKLSTKDTLVVPGEKFTKANINTKFSELGPNPLQSGTENPIFDKKESLSRSQRLIKNEVSFGGNKGDESFNEFVGFKRARPDPITIEISLNAEFNLNVNDQALDHEFTINNNLKKIKVDNVFNSESGRSKDDNNKINFDIDEPSQNLIIEFKGLGSQKEDQSKIMDMEPNILNKDDFQIDTKNKEENYNCLNNSNGQTKIYCNKDFIDINDNLNQKAEEINIKQNNIKRNDNYQDSNISFNLHKANNLDSTNTNIVNHEFVIDGNNRNIDSSKNIYAKKSKSDEDGSNSKMSEPNFAWYQVFGNDVTLDKLKTINKLQFQYQKLSKE